MVDSPAPLDWQVPASAELRNFYSKKGRGSPSAKRVPIWRRWTNGYGWSGKSSAMHTQSRTKAREIIPAEIVFSPEGGVRRLVMAGIEFQRQDPQSRWRAAAAA